jgi:hypothetical protein
MTPTTMAKLIFLFIGIAVSVALFIVSVLSILRDRTLFGTRLAWLLVSIPALLLILGLSSTAYNRMRRRPRTDRNVFDRTADALDVLAALWK